MKLASLQMDVRVDAWIARDATLHQAAAYVVRREVWNELRYPLVAGLPGRLSSGLGGDLLRLCLPEGG